MAHLSDVTHQRLDLRRAGWDEGETTHTKGIRNEGCFEGYIRCVEVTSTPGEYYTGMTVWTGEGDGSIRVRRGNTGQVVFGMQRRYGVHVTAMLSYGGYMWCGLSDGYLRVFDEYSFDLAFETKQHSGAITAMVALGGFIYSASQDWQILQWEATTFRYMIQLSGHQNAVACLATDGQTLYSGGADYVIRAWNLETMQEKSHPWPIIGHRGSIRALVVEDVFLFSASMDGTMKVWNTQSGELVKFLDHRDGPIMCLMKDPAANRIWAGGVDGVICVWDCQSLNLVTRLFDHSGTYVNTLKMLSRVNSLKVYCLCQNGTVKVWNADCHPTDPQHQIASLRQDQEMQHTVDHMRAAIIQNYEELELRKAELARIESIDAYRKRGLAAALGRKARLTVEHRSYATTLHLIDKRRQQRIKADIATTLVRTSTEAFVRIYYAKLVAFATMSAEQRRKDHVATILATTTTKGLQIQYWKNLQAYARLCERQQKRELSAAMLLRTTARGVQVIYFATLKAFRLMRVRRRQRETATQCLLACTNQGLKRRYFFELLGFRHQAVQVKTKLRAINNFLPCTERGRRYLYFWKWREWIKVHQRERIRYVRLGILLRNTDWGMRALYFRKLKTFAHDHAAMMAPQREYERLRDENEALERVLNQRELSEEELWMEMEAEGAKLRAIHDETAEIEDQRRFFEQETNKVKARIANAQLREMGYNITAEEDAGICQQLLDVLKGRAVHCQYDIDTVGIIRQEAKGNELKVYESGLKQVKKAIEKENLKNGFSKKETFPAGTDEWCLARKENKELMSRKALGQARHGLCQMVVANDMMSLEKRKHVPHSNEVARNALLLIQIVDAARRSLVEYGGEPKGKGSGKKSSGKKRAGSSAGKGSSKKRRSASASSSKKRRPSGSSTRGGSVTPRKPGTRSASSPARGRSSTSRKSAPSPAARGSSSSKKRAASGGSKSSTKKKSGSSSKKKTPKSKVSGSSTRRAPSPRPGVSTRLTALPRMGVSGTQARPASPRPVSPRPKVSKKSGGSSKKKRAASPRPKTSKTSSVKRRAATPSGTRKVSSAAAPKSPRPKVSATHRAPSPQPKVSRRAASPRPKVASTSAKRPPSPRPGAAKRKPKAEQCWLGLVLDVSPAMADHVCRVEEVTPGGPAAAAGLSPNDVLTSLGGVAVADLVSFRDAFTRQAAVGKTLAFNAIHDDGAEFSGSIEVKSILDRDSA